MNVTVPLKEEAYSIAHRHSERARFAGAANVLSFKDDGEIVADNTDGYGLVTDLMRNQHLVLKGKVVFLLGAGGAARGVLGNLASQDPSLIQFSNRTISKVDKLCNLLPKTCPREVVAWGRKPIVKPDIVINATSLSLIGDVPAIHSSVLVSSELVYDMMYSATPTAFMKLALGYGAKKVSDGLGMLVEQAAESYRIWNGSLPRTDIIISRLRAI
jgi:shikimate dehydrogenase